MAASPTGIGYRIIIGVGALIWAGSLWWYVEYVGSKPDFLGQWLPGQIVQGIGVGATFPLLGSAALSALGKGASYATASAVIGTVRQVGAVIGIALLVILIGKPAPHAFDEALRRGWAMAAICFVAVALGTVLLGRARRPAAEVAEPDSGPPTDSLGSGAGPAPIFKPDEPLPSASPDADVLSSLPLFAGLDADTLAELHEHAEQVEVHAGSYLFHKGDDSHSLYVVRNGRLQVLDNDVVVAELGRGQVVGELGLLIDAPRSASVRAVRDSSLVRLTKAEFDKIADASVLGALVEALARRQYKTPRTTAPKASPEVVVAVVAADDNAPVAMVAAELCTALSSRLRVVAPGQVDRDGLERAERSADRVVLQAVVDDARWRDYCLRVADRVVLVAGHPAPPAEPLPAGAVGADLVLAGPPAGRQHRQAWEELITPRSVHEVSGEHLADDLRPLAARIAGRSVGLVLSGGGARALAHLGVIEELEAAGITVDRFAGTSMGAIMAALAATGLDAAGVDAQMYEHYVRRSHADYTLPTRGLIRGRRTLASLRTTSRRSAGRGAAKAVPLRQRRPAGPADHGAPPRPARRRHRLFAAAARAVRADGLQRVAACRRWRAGQRAGRRAGGARRPADRGQRELGRQPTPRSQRDRDIQPATTAQPPGTRHGRHPHTHHDDRQRDVVGVGAGACQPGDPARPNWRGIHGVSPDRPRPRGRPQCDPCGVAANHDAGGWLTGLSVSRHRGGPRDMAIEAQRCRHVAIAIPQLRIVLGFAVRPRQ